jgi:hypothetical protein
MKKWKKKKKNVREIKKGNTWDLNPVYTSQNRIRFLVGIVEYTVYFLKF